SSRLILAGARPLRASETDMAASVGRAACGPQPLVPGRVLAQAVAQLAFDLGLALVVDVQRQDAVPLEARLALTPDGPIGVAQMVVDLGVGGLLVDGALQIDHRRLILSLTELGPA